MHFTLINRREIKQQANTLLSSPQVGAKKMTLFYLGIVALLSVCATILPSANILESMMGLSLPSLEPMVLIGTFVSILVSLMTHVLYAGFILYCMAVRNERHTGFASLFDGFSFAGKLISLAITELFYIWLWSMLFFFPGIIAAYRYRFAILNLCQNPELTPREALQRSKQQSRGYKLQLFMLDLSYVPWMLLSDLVLIFFYGIAFDMVGLGSLTLPTVLVQTIVCSIWSAGVACFYLPQYQTSEILYFDIAQGSSNTNSSKKADNTHEIWE